LTSELMYALDGMKPAAGNNQGITPIGFTLAP
jgi:hypothetical protein